VGNYSYLICHMRVSFFQTMIYGYSCQMPGWRQVPKIKHKVDLMLVPNIKKYICCRFVILVDMDILVECQVPKIKCKVDLMLVPNIADYICYSCWFQIINGEIFPVDLSIEERFIVEDHATAPWITLTSSSFQRE
jgi:hypothetical protein